MSTDVLMPQMGESITEGTITKWLKKVGEQVEKDEPLFEISTDKVDAEIPAPIAGVLSEIRYLEGEVVKVNAVVAVLSRDAPQSAEPLIGKAAGSKESEAPPFGTNREATNSRDGDAARSSRSSPLVRDLEQENNVDNTDVLDAGIRARTSEHDVLRHLEHSDEKTQSRALNLRSEVVPLSRMRSIIAQRMVESSQTSPHVHTSYKVDMTRVVKVRERAKATFEQREGFKLTYLPFIATAVVSSLQKHPIINASLVNQAIHYHSAINLGIAVALDWGLIVPVVLNAEQLEFVSMARKIADVAIRARSKKLNPEEAAGSTFTITNSGIFGDEFTTPIINQPDSAILCVSGLKQEPAVVTDTDGNEMIAIRSMLHLTLGFDHRLIDGANACRFMLDVKAQLETWDSSEIS